MSRELDARIFKIVGGFNMFFGSIPYFSTDMNAAVDVLEEMRKQGKLAAMYQWELDDEILWGADIDGSPLAASQHQSLPIAICLAALLAAGDGDWVEKYLKESTDES